MKLSRLRALEEEGDEYGLLLKGTRIPMLAGEAARNVDEGGSGAGMLDINRPAGVEDVCKILRLK